MGLRIIEPADHAAQSDQPISTAPRLRILEPADPITEEPQQDFMRGLAQGARTVANNTADLNPVSLLFGQSNPQKAMDESARRYIEETPGVQPSAAGRMTGEIAASLPLAFAGGPLTSGALQGYAASENDDLAGKLGDAALGAIGGKVAGKAVDAVAAGVRGVADPVIRRLADAGVRLPPGVALGQTMKRLEDRASSLPVVGGMIDKARAQSMDDWRSSALDAVMEPLGIKLPKGVSGHDAIAFVQDSIANSYDNLLPQLSAKVDPRFAVGLRKAFDEVKVAAPETKAKLGAIIEDAIKAAPDGTMSGEVLRRAEMKFGQYISDLGRSANPDDAALRRAVQSTLGDLRDLMVRANPKSAAELKATHQAFKNQIAVDTAASKAVDAKFSPAQLSQGSRQADRSVRKRVTARGNAPMQSVAADGRVLQSMVPNSGTADRAALFNPIALALGVPAAALYAAATQAGRVMSGPRSPQAIALAAQIKKLARPASAVGSTATANRPRN